MSKRIMVLSFIMLFAVQHTDATDPGVACIPGAGSCCEANGSPGCDDGGYGCCEAVCACDPYCCETESDEQCATTNGRLCGAALMCPRCMDADNDGVPDGEDVCCSTPEGITVDVVGRPVGDFDVDCDVDLEDHAFLAGNTTRPAEDDGPCCTPDTCDDGLYCNGFEVCAETGSCTPGQDPCLDVDCDGSEPICAEGLTFAICSCPPLPCVNFTLNVDHLTGTSGDDRFCAPLEFNPSSGAQIATFQTGDSVIGLAGYDVLEASLNVSGTVVPASVASIETIKITNSASGLATLGAMNITGAETLYQVGSLGDLSVTGLEEPTDFGFVDVRDSTVDFSMNFANASTTAGSSDQITCILDAATAGIATIATNDVNGFEVLRFVSEGVTRNSLQSFRQVTGTTMHTALFSGTAGIAVGELTNTITTYDASSLVGSLSLGSGTQDTNYAEFANPTSNIISITGGPGDDLIIFENTLATTDFTAGTLDLGDGTDVVQNSYGTTFGAASKMRNVEEMRVNATANGVSVIFNGHTGLTMITIEEDGTANTFTLSNVPATDGVFPTLNFRGDNSQAAQTYDTITYSAAGASTGCTSDALHINVGNRGTALNASGTSNAHTVGAITAAGFETLTIDVTDGPATFGGLTSTGLISCTITGSSNVTTGTIAPASGVTVLTMNTSGVTGSFNGTFDYVATGASYTGGSGNDTLTFGTNSTATTTTVALGDGNNTFTGDTNTQSADTITAGSGNDTITGGPGADTITVGSGSDTVNLDNSDTDETSIDTVTDFTIGEDTITFDISSLEARDVNTGAADDVVDYGHGSPAAASAFTIEVTATDGATAGSAVDMVIIDDSLATFVNAAAYIAATSATVVWQAATPTAGDVVLLAYEDGSSNTRVGLFTDLGGGGANTDSLDLGEDILILSGVNADSLTSFAFNNWE